MQVREQGPKPGRIWTLEVTGLGRRGLARIIQAIPGTSVRHFPGWLSWLSTGPFCRFDFLGQHFVVESSEINSSAFEITPEPRGCKPETELLKQALVERL